MCHRLLLRGLNKSLTTCFLRSSLRNESQKFSAIVIFKVGSIFFQNCHKTFQLFYLPIYHSNVISSRSMLFWNVAKTTTNSLQTLITLLLEYVLNLFSTYFFEKELWNFETILLTLYRRNLSTVVWDFSGKIPLSRRPVLSNNSHKFPIILFSRNICSFAVKSVMMVAVALPWVFANFHHFLSSSSWDLWQLFF